MESIFHNIVRYETAYTRLLCNMLKRDAEFRSAFLTLCGLDTELVVPENIKAEKGLVGGCGQADILIRTDRLRMIVEIKTEAHRGTQSTQELGEGKTYLAWLRTQADTTHRQLVFLVPSDWKHRPSVEKKLAEYMNSADSNGVDVKLLVWAQMLPILKKSPNNLAEEFRLLIDERFGPIGFEQDERQLMFNGEFPLETTVKLVKLIDDIRQKSGIPFGELEIAKTEMGFYFSKKGKENSCWLYLGCWPDFWKQCCLSPICFGVSSVATNVRDAFAKALKKVYGQEPRKFDDYLMGYIPEEDLDTDDALEVIKPKLQQIWTAMSAADA